MNHCDACAFREMPDDEIEDEHSIADDVCAACGKLYECPGCTPEDRCTKCNGLYCLDCGGHEPICSSCWVET